MATSSEPTNIPSRSPDGGEQQLGLLLDTAKDMLGEEFRRTERLEAKSRHALSASGALFAVVMATTAGVLNALLGHQDLAGWVIPVVGGAALVSVYELGWALVLSLMVQSLRPTGVLDIKTIEGYIGWAEKGHPAVGKNLIKTYAQLLRSRREKNAQRAQVLKAATVTCGVAAGASLLQLFAVFVALITQ